MIGAHVQALLAAGNARIRWILCTHTHLDHSPAAAALKAATGATVIGLPAPPGASQDRGFAPELLPAHGERLRLGEVTLRALHTPGHASNHVCYLLEETKMLFTGDHLMQGSTVVINPPDGDMRACIRGCTRSPRDRSLRIWTSSSPRATSSPRPGGTIQGQSSLRKPRDEHARQDAQAGNEPRPLRDRRQARRAA
jgi:glyoxylase-like metal-dependent hydrolase (beta-lactamase superfamily II)